MNEKVCRLCLQTISGNYQTIGESLKYALNLNVNISKEAVNCSECTNSLEVFLKFKSACDYVREGTLSADLKDDIHLDPQGAEITDNLILPTESKHEVKCSFCTKTAGTEFFTLLNESKQHKFLVDVLKEHIPKLNLIMTEDLFTCETCLDGLPDVLSFVTRCLEVEQKISKYMEIKGTDEKGQIKLKYVQQFTLTYDQFQAETEMRYEKEMDPELFIKTEEVDIKSEDSDCDSLQEPSTTFETDESLDISVLQSLRRRIKDAMQRGLTHVNSDRVTIYKCEACPYETKNENCLRIHKLTHRNTAKLTMFKCDLCSYRTQYQQNLKHHKLVLHKSTSEITMLKCELCPFKTKCQAYLKRHTLKHRSTSQLTELKCALCPFQTEHWDSLEQHKLTHQTVQTMFKCYMRQNIRNILNDTH